MMFLLIWTLIVSGLATWLPSQILEHFEISTCMQTAPIPYYPIFKPDLIMQDCVNA